MCKGHFLPAINNRGYLRRHTEWYFFRDLHESPGRGDEKQATLFGKMSLGSQQNHMGKVGHEPHWQVC